MLWIPLSALQHYRFCPRQCALIHVESIWDENRLTAEGRVLHERVHASAREKRDGMIIVRGMRLYSHLHGLSGVADVVEFHPADDTETGMTLPGEKGKWQPFPVEYKRGRAKKGGLDEEQLAAQALCLSEMFSLSVPSGALYYGGTKRRTDVHFTEALFRYVVELAGAVRSMLETGHTPVPAPSERCKACSLVHSCLPNAVSRSVSEYYRSGFN